MLQESCRYFSNDSFFRGSEMDLNIRSKLKNQTIMETKRIIYEAVTKLCLIS